MEMKNGIYAVFDRGTNEFQTPFSVKHDVIALRSFRAEIKRPGDYNPLRDHPGDFELWRICWITETGEVETDKKMLSSNDQIMNEVE